MIELYLIKHPVVSCFSQCLSISTVYREYKILGLLDFTSKRKRMSVIVQDEEGQIFLLCKGADRSVSQIFFIFLPEKEEKERKKKIGVGFIFNFLLSLTLMHGPLLKLYSIIFERLSKNGRMYEESTSKHLNEYGEAGLRTLALAYRKLEASEYSAWNNEFQKAKTSIGADRESMLERVSDMIEKELILVGATAVEDKLQKGVMKHWSFLCLVCFNIFPY